MPQIRLIADSVNTNDIIICKAELYEKLALAEQQIGNGELLDGETFFDGLKKKYGKQE